MQVIRYVAKLNHLRHGHSLSACAQHVNNTEAQKVSLRFLLALSGGLEILAGLPALITPAPLISLLLGGPVDPIASVLARLFGAGVFALGLACLKARDDVRSSAGQAVSLGITAYNVLAAVVLIWTAAASDFGGLLLWVAGIGHAALGALFVLALTRIIHEASAASADA
jgi:hypothetical protein